MESWRVSPIGRAGTHTLAYGIQHPEAVGALRQIGTVVGHPGQKERDRRVGSTNDAEASWTGQQSSSRYHAPK